MHYRNQWYVYLLDKNILRIFLRQTALSLKADANMSSCVHAVWLDLPQFKKNKSHISLINLAHHKSIFASTLSASLASTLLDNLIKSLSNKDIYNHPYSRLWTEQQLSNMPMTCVRSHDKWMKGHRSPRAPHLNTLNKELFIFTSHLQRLWPNPRHSANECSGQSQNESRHVWEVKWLYRKDDIVIK